MTGEQGPRPVKASAVESTPEGPVIGSSMLLSDENVAGITSCLGVAVIPAGQGPTAQLTHETDEVMYVSRGSGDLITPGARTGFTEGDAIFIPAHLPHGLHNTGEGDLVSVYSFPWPNRPPSSD